MDIWYSSHSIFFEPPTVAITSAVRASFQTHHCLSVNCSHSSFILSFHHLLRSTAIHLSLTMTNAPENFESYVLPDGVEKVEYTPDPKVPNAGTFKLEREDHTFANLLRMQLYRDPDVVFVGYKHPHPIQHHNIILRVQTSSKPSTGDVYPPNTAVGNAIVEVLNEIRSLRKQVDAQPRQR